MTAPGAKRPLSLRGSLTAIDPEETIVVSAAQRQLAERSGRSTRGPTAHSLAKVADGLRHEYCQQWSMFQTASVKLLRPLDPQNWSATCRIRVGLRSPPAAHRSTHLPRMTWNLCLDKRVLGGDAHADLRFLTEFERVDSV